VSERNYHVTFGVSTTGDDPEEAAFQALHLMKKLDFGEHVFDVEDVETGVTVQVRARLDDERVLHLDRED